MTIDEAKHKMDFLKIAYQKLIDEKVDSGKLVGDGVSGEWKAETPLDEAYKDIIEALDLAIKALEQQQNIHDKCKRCVEFSEFEQKPCEDWLQTFNTDSATECFTAVQRLKESVKNGKNDTKF